MSNSVSVILPYFNRVDTVAAAALSVLTQTHFDVTLYLVNDGSTDASRSSLGAIQDGRVRHLDLASNSGVCAARNRGLVTASTDLVAFMDSDDEWLPEKLEHQIISLRRRQADGQRLAVLGCGWRLRGASEDRPFMPGPFTRREMLRGVPGTGTPMLLVDRSVAFEDACFDESFRSLEERDYVLSCLSNGSVLGVLPEPLVIVSRGRSDHVANPIATANAWDQLLLKYENDLSLEADLRSWYHFRAGREYLVAGQRRRALVHMREALLDRRMRRSVHLALGMIGRQKGLALAQKVLPL